MTTNSASPNPQTAQRRGILIGGGLVLVVLILGNVLGAQLSPVLHSRMLPWITGRGFGIAAYLDLTFLVMIGTWFRHPSRRLHPLIAPQAQLQIHRLLAIGVVVFAAVHIISLTLDPFAHVGWMGAIIIGTSVYRPFAIALGTASLYLGILVVGTAVWAGRLFGHAWVHIHHAAIAVYVLAWFHGVLAGSDTPTLRPMYLITGLLVLALFLSRILTSPVVEPPGSTPHPSGEPTL